MKKDINELDIFQLLELYKKAKIFEGLPGQVDLARGLELEIQARKETLGLNQLLGWYDSHEGNITIRIALDSIEVYPSGEFMPTGKFYVVSEGKTTHLPDECPRFVVCGESKFGLDRKYRVDLDLESKTISFVASNINTHLEMTPITEQVYNGMIDGIRAIFNDDYERGDGD